MSYNQYNNQSGNRDFRVYPTYTVTSFSSMTGGDKYLTIDIWANRLTFTFVDQSNKDYIKSLKFLISIDKLYLFTEILRNINSDRINGYRNGTPYSVIEEGKLKIEVTKVGAKSDSMSKSYISIYTKEFDSVSRLCLCGMSDDIKIEIIIGTNYLDVQVTDTNRLANIDLQDIVLTKLVSYLEKTPLLLTIYKMLMGFSETFIGVIKRDRSNGNIYKDGPRYINKKNSSNNDYVYNKNPSNRLVSNTTNDDDINSDDAEWYT